MRPYSAARGLVWGGRSVWNTIATSVFKAVVEIINLFSRQVKCETAVALANRVSTRTAKPVANRMLLRRISVVGQHRRANGPSLSIVRFELTRRHGRGIKVAR